jgi:hypothetical protein
MLLKTDSGARSIFLLDSARQASRWRKPAPIRSAGRYGVEIGIGVAQNLVIHPAKSLRATDDLNCLAEQAHIKEKLTASLEGKITEMVHLRHSQEQAVPRKKLRIAYDGEPASHARDDCWIFAALRRANAISLPIVYLVCHRPPISYHLYSRWLLALVIAGQAGWGRPIRYRPDGPA